MRRLARIRVVLGMLAVGTVLAAVPAVSRAQTTPPAAAAPVNVAELKRDADASCNPLDRLNGDSLFTVLTVKYGSFDASTSARALAAATDQLLIQYYWGSYVCRARLAREGWLRHAASSRQHTLGC